MMNQSDGTLQSIENIPSEIESQENENGTGDMELLNFRFQARNLTVDWRKLSLIDVDRISETMDIDQLQEYIELVTYASLDELTDIDPLFVKLFRLSQFTIEYLLHSQDYLKLILQKEKKKISKKDKIVKITEDQINKIKNENILLKKENKKRRRMLEEQQRMMEVGANSFYKCPICPSKSFLNATYLQSHLHRRHPEHSSYIGDAILHTKAITEGVEKKLGNVEMKIEEEKKQNQERIEKAKIEQKRAEEQLIEHQDHIQRLERAKYENKLRELEESFQNEVEALKAKEKRFINRIGELEEKAEKQKKNESMIKSLKKEIPQLEDNVYMKLSEMESSFRQQQQVAEEQARRLEDSIDGRLNKTIEKQQKTESKVSFVEKPMTQTKKVKSNESSDHDRNRKFEMFKQQFRPSMVNLLLGELEKLGIHPNQDGLTDNMFKMKMEDLRNNRAGKIMTRPNFHDYRNEIEVALQKRSEQNLAHGFETQITQSDNERGSARPRRPENPPNMQKSPRRPASKPGVPKRPINPPKSPIKSNENRSQWSDISTTASPGKPHFASTMRNNSDKKNKETESNGIKPKETEIQSSSDWDQSEQIPKPMKDFKENLADSVDVETIEEITEDEPASSAWDSPDDSIGANVKEKAEKIESKLANRSSSDKPAGGIDLSGVQDQTNLAVDDLFEGILSDEN
jgi:hypothetical protein